MRHARGTGLRRRRLAAPRRALRKRVADALALRHDSGARRDGPLRRLDEESRLGNANRKYTRLLAQKKRELGRNISYDDLPNIVTDEEFEREVGMSKDSFASLMKERDKMGADMAHEYQKTAQKIKQSIVDRFNPIKIVEMFLNAGEPFSAEKSA